MAGTLRWPARILNIQLVVVGCEVELFVAVSVGFKYSFVFAVI